MYLFDIHSHILPGIDDGVTTVDEAIEILKSAYDDGIRHIVLTPHYYARERSVNRFIDKRKRQFDKLKEEISRLGIKCPKLYLGAEVNLSTDISEIENIEKLAIEGTNYILVEMPYSVWQEWMYASLFNLMSMKNLVPIIAHVERYMNAKNNERILRLSEMDVYFQINATSLLEKAYSGFVTKLICNNFVFFLGSDTHDREIRPNRLKEAVLVLEKKVSKKYVEFLMTNAHMMIDNRYIERTEAKYVSKEKLSFFSKLLNIGSI